MDESFREVSSWLADASFGKKSRIQEEDSLDNYFEAVAEVSRSRSSQAQEQVYSSLMSRK